MKLDRLLSPLAPWLLLAGVHCSGGGSATVGSTVDHLQSENVCGKSSGYVIYQQPDGSFTGGTTLPACSADSQCIATFTADTSATVQGRCVGGTCDFDACERDSNCPSGTACICMGGTHAPGNQCLLSQCRVDADCGAGGLCSPSMSEAGPFYGIQGRYCRTPSDTCQSDADCNAQGAGTCVYESEVGHWGCSYSHAAG
jgi:hypothetical protein